MAEVIYSNLTDGSAPLEVSEDGRTLKMNKQGTVTFSIVSANVSIKAQDGQKHEYKSSRGVVQAPHGVKVLPYFMRGIDWYVVMVEQFRIAVPVKTIEPPGGEMEEWPQVSMARELAEEARITVKAEDIDYVFCAYIQPSMMDAKAFGGIVLISESMLPKELVGGEWQFGEYTVVSTYKLVDLLKRRDEMTWEPDLETYLLLDAVAKKIGLLAKRY